MASTVEETDRNHYAILGVERNATHAQVTSAYRRTALKCHPDKDPNNPHAAESFHQVAEALKILSDPTSRAALDKHLDDKLAEELRKTKLHPKSFCSRASDIEDHCKKKWQQDKWWVFEQMDAMERAAAASPAAQQRNLEAERQRQRFKDELEAREKAASLVAEQQRKATEQLERQKENLRKAGRKYQAEQERLKNQAEQDRQRRDANAGPDSVIQSPDTTLDFSLILRLKWRSKKTDVENGGYSEDVIKYLFSSYGEVSAVIVSSRRNGSAIIEFTKESAASDALKRERGLPSNPLTVSRSLPSEEKSSANTSRSTFVETNSSITKGASLQTETNDIMNKFEKMKV